MESSPDLLICQLALGYQAHTGQEAIDYWDNFWEFIYPWVIPEPTKDKFFSEESGPDICYRCLYYFGETISGRVRDGCPKCQGYWKDLNRSSTDRFYHYLQDKLGSSKVELLMARALFIHAQELAAKTLLTNERKKGLIKWA